MTEPNWKELALKMAKEKKGLQNHLGDEIAQVSRAIKDLKFVLTLLEDRKSSLQTLMFSSGPAEKEIWERVKEDAAEREKGGMP